MTNKDKFLQLVSVEDTKTLAEIKKRIKNRAMLRESQKIALKVLLKLDELNWSQKDLAEKMNVSPQQINKIVSGKENLTLETIIKLQNILDIPVLATYYDKPKNQIKELTINTDSKYKVSSTPMFNYEINSKSFQMDYNQSSGSYSHYKKVI